MIDRVLTAMLAMQRQSWEQGVAAHAALDLGRHDLARLLAAAAVVRQAPDGRLGDVNGEDGAVNGAACGEAVLAAGFPDAARRQLTWLAERAPRSADGTLFHLLSRREVWADTVYMVVPFLALAGRPDLAMRQVDGHRRRLCRDGLYSAIWSEDSGSPRRPAHWGGASGWVVAGIARALRLVPSLPRDDLAAHAREVLDACFAHRRADGLFHDVLDEPSTFVETNAAQMFAYAALLGAADGWLPRSYADIGRELAAAAAAKVDDQGLVTGACGSPGFDRPGTSTEAQAFHLIVHAELNR